MQQADFIIIGGGSSGCILAARLTQNPHIKVILLEAGMDCHDPQSFPDLASPYPGIAYSNPRYTWPGLSANFGYHGANQPANRQSRYEQARILGGGSAINGIGANRGSPQDYDEWEALGCEGWSWQDCLPYFRKLERDLDIDNEFHGRDGPFPVRRRGSEIWTDFTHMMLEICKAKNIPFLADQNGRWEDGIFEMVVNMNERRERVSVAWAYLTSEVRARPNLDIRTKTTVKRLIVDGGKVCGVQIMGEGQNAAEGKILTGRHIVVSAGALSTPAILMRSGIGPAAHLADCGIEVKRDVPAVGQNLLEHPSCGLIPFLKPFARQKGKFDYHIPIGYRFSSGHDGCPAGDMHMNFVTRATWNPVGRQMGALFFWVNKSYSQGQLLLNREMPDAPPRIDFRMLSDRRDLIRLADAFERAVWLTRDPRFESVTDGLYAGGMSEMGRRFSKPTKIAKWITALGAAGLDIMGRRQREKFFPFLFSNYHDPLALVGDRDALEGYIAETVGGVWHPSGTCRMGRVGDKMAVTNHQGRVVGFDNLFICDASLMPTIPCANINVPTMMIAEKIADGLHHFS